MASISTLAIEDLSGRRITLNCVQYKDIESSSLIKYDFIALDTLTQMKEICELIKIKGGKDIDIEKIPIDDNRTMKLFQNGQTDDIFLFSSNDMNRNLQDFHPTSFEDLVILNCLLTTST